MVTAAPGLLHRIKALHHDDGGACAECGRPHPCETYRTADGYPAWPDGPVTELRCPGRMPKLLGKRFLPEGLVEVACSNCARRHAGPGPRPRVLHRFNLLGELVETVTEPGGGVE